MDVKKNTVMARGSEVIMNLHRLMIHTVDGSEIRIHNRRLGMYLQKPGK